MGNGIPGRSKKSVDCVGIEQADKNDLASYDGASAKLKKLHVPLFIRGSGRSRLYIAAFDGTGNSLIDDELPTNTGLVVRQLGEVVGHNPDLGYDYLEGIGTQDNRIVRVADQAFGATYEPKIEDMYLRFIRRAADWRRHDPNAEITLASIGFSRGAVQAAGFARLVHERGIQDPDGIRRVRGEDGRMEIVFTRPPLVPPGQVAQALGLFDPVATGLPALDDVRLPPSVLSAFQITAEDERRDWFPGMDIVPRGLSRDGRFLNVVVGGAHSDIGGGYRLDGLAIRSGNLMVDYLNALADAPLLRKRPVPDDPALNVVHRSEDHLPIYSEWRFRLSGQRGHQPAADGSLLCAMGLKCAPPEPVDPSLAARFEFRPVSIGVVPEPHRLLAESRADRQEHAGASGFPPAAVRQVEELFERLAGAASRREAPAMDAVAAEYASTDSGLLWWRSIEARRGAVDVEFPYRHAATAEAAQAARQHGIEVPAPQAMRL